MTDTAIASPRSFPNTRTRPRGSQRSSFARDGERPRDAKCSARTQGTPGLSHLLWQICGASWVSYPQDADHRSVARAGVWSGRFDVKPACRSFGHQKAHFTFWESLPRTTPMTVALDCTSLPFSSAVLSVALAAAFHSPVLLSLFSVSSQEAFIWNLPAAVHLPAVGDPRITSSPPRLVGHFLIGVVFMAFSWVPNRYLFRSTKLMISSGTSQYLISRVLKSKCSFIQVFGAQTDDCGVGCGVWGEVGWSGVWWWWWWCGRSV